MSFLPRELLLDIFAIGCEFEFDDYTAPISIHLVKWRKRHLKRFVQPVSQVCPLWRQLVHTTPSFWVTILTLNLHSRTPFHGQMGQLQKLLDNSRDSEIDFWFRPPQHPSAISFEEVQNWLCERILLPCRHRIRAVFTEALTLEHGKLVMDQLEQGQWPALRILSLRAGVADCVISARTISAPNLRYLETNEMTWKDDASPFNACSSFYLVRGKRALSPVTSTTSWSLIRSHISRPSQHLKSLKIDVISTTYHVTSQLGQEIELPNLSKLSVSATLSDQVIAWLNAFRAPRLQELRLITFVEPSQYREDFHNKALFGQVKRLALAMPIECLPLLLNGAPIEVVEDLVLCVGAQSSLIPGACPTIKFLSLQNLVIDGSRASSSEGSEIHPVFFSLFDFSPACKNVRLAFRVKGPQKLAFPHTPRLRIDDLNDLMHLQVPALRYLTVPISETTQALHLRSGLSFIPASDIPFQNLETLHLSGCSFPDLDTAPGEGVLCIAPNLVNLVMSNLPAIITKKGYRLPIDWRGVDVERRPANLSLVFPTRKQGDSATYLHAANTIVDATKLLLRERKDLGHPVRSLTLFNAPSHLNFNDILSGEVENFEIVRGTNEFHWATGHP